MAPKETQMPQNSDITIYHIRQKKKDRNNIVINNISSFKVIFHI